MIEHITRLPHGPARAHIANLTKGFFQMTKAADAQVLPAAWPPGALRAERLIIGVSVRREAIEQSRASGGLQHVRAAAARGM
jgi:hypothetical protein